VRSVRAAAADPDEAVASVLKRNEGARRDVEAERLRMAIEQYVATPWAKANDFGGIDSERWKRASNQIGLAFDFRNKARSIDAFTDVFLPAVADRSFLSAD